MIDPASVATLPEIDPLRPPVGPVAAGPSFAALIGGAVVADTPPVPVLVVDPFPPAAMIGPHRGSSGDGTGERDGAAARVFNQDGLFARAVAFAMRPVDGAAAPAADGKAPSIPSVAEAPPPVPVAACAPAAVGVAPAGAVAVAPAQVRIGRVPPRSIEPLPIGSAARVDMRRDAGAARPMPMPMPMPVRRARPAAAAAAPVAVAVHAVGHGLAVVARLEALDPDERTRIAEEIAALLAIHGHAPGRIAVLARPTRPRNA